MKYGDSVALKDGREGTVMYVGGKFTDVKIDDVTIPIANELITSVKYDVKEHLDKLNKRIKWEEDHKVQAFFKSSLPRFIRNIPDIPRDILQDHIAGTQRMKRGWANRDTWSFDVYLAEVIIGGLTHLKENLHGVPCDFGSKDGMEIDLEGWKTTLDDIIWTFETSLKITERDWFYGTAKVRVRWGKLYKEAGIDTYIMTKEECVKYRNGWRLFQKYFFSLWD